MPVDLPAMKRQFLAAREAYYNADFPIMTDKAFDALEDQIRKLEPTWKHIHMTGAPVADKKIETDLPYFMPSLDKMYEKDVPKFYVKKIVAAIRDWIWMDKLDGTSLQLEYFKGRPTRLFTRGDGIRGGEISFLIPALVERGRIPALIDTTERTTFRLEALMPIKTFEQKWSRKVSKKHGFDNIRNMVNGLFNRKTAHAALADVDMVVLGVYGMTLQGGHMCAREWGFKVVRASYVSEHLPGAVLNELLAARKASSIYEMDGLVGASTLFRMEYKTADKPKATRAFKFNDEANADQVEVLDLTYQKSRLTRWTPVIHITPTLMDGAMVSKATAHNPAWLKEHGIGPGAIVKVLRSGGVIPKIVGVVKKAAFKEPPGPYVQRGRFFYMVERDKGSDLRAIHHFMTTMGVELLALQTLDKLYDEGYTDAHAYLKVAADRVSATYSNANWERFVKAGIGPNQSKRILIELGEVLNKTLSLKLLMVASGSFEAGLGVRVLSMIEADGLSMRDMLNMKTDELRARLMQIKNFKEKRVELIIDGLSRFKPWMKAARLFVKYNGDLPKPKPVAGSGALQSLNVSWTSYRSKEQEAFVEANGGTVIPFGSKTDVLLYHPNGKPSTKVEKAGTKAMIWTDFLKKYGL
jgi:DNA ligase (NAD+)